MAEGTGLDGRFSAWSRQNKAVIKGVEFTFRKLPAMDAYDVIEDIRVALNGQAVANALASIDAGSDGITMAQIGSALGSLPRLVSKSDLAAIRAKMFRAVDFRKLDTGDTAAPLVADISDEARAFEKTGPMAIYEVLGRSLAVNFTEFLSDALSALNSPD